MRVRRIAHKGLCRLYEENSSKAYAPTPLDKLRKMLTFLEAMENPKELRGRLTFRIEDDEIIDLNIEDYH